MTEEEKGKQKTSESPQPITRREFAISSVVILGASIADAATMPPLSPEAQAMKLEISNEVNNLLLARHIDEDDIKRVIDHAEKTGQKLYQQENNVFLSKLRVQEAYFYAEYSPMEGGYRVHAAYTHRFLLSEDTGDQ